MKKKNGFTVVELIVSFVIISVVVLLIFDLSISLRNTYVLNGIKTEGYIKQGLISKAINDDFKSEIISGVSSCAGSDYCYEFTFASGVVKRLEIDEDALVIKYGTFATKLLEDSKIIEVSIKSFSATGAQTENFDSLLYLNIEIENEVLETRFDINATYLYDSRTSTLGVVSFD